MTWAIRLEVADSTADCSVALTIGGIAMVTSGLNDVGARFSRFKGLA